MGEWDQRGATFRLLLVGAGSRGIGAARGGGGEDNGSFVGGAEAREESSDGGGCSEIWVIFERKLDADGSVERICDAGLSARILVSAKERTEGRRGVSLLVCDWRCLLVARRVHPLAELPLLLLAQALALLLDALGVMPRGDLLGLLLRARLFERALSLLELLDEVLSLRVVRFEALRTRLLQPKFRVDSHAPQRVEQELVRLIELVELAR